VKRKKDIESQLKRSLKDFMWSDLDKYIFWSIINNDNVYLAGPTGSGKSSRVRLMNYQYNKINKKKDPKWVDVPFYRASLRETVDESQLIGGLTVTSKKGISVTSYLDGIITKAMRSGGWVLLDEIDAARAEILFSLHPVFENPRELCLLDNDSEIILGHPEFKVIVTGNTYGRGDLTGLYRGTKILNEAFLDRFTIFDISYPSADKEIKYLSKFCSEGVAEGLVLLASKIRIANSKEMDALSFTISVRKTEELARKSVYWGLEKTLKIVLLSRLDPEERTILSDLILKIFSLNLSGD